jgi:hypothetical protein
MRWGCFRIRDVPKCELVEKGGGRAVRVAEVMCFVEVKGEVYGFSHRGGGL